MEVVLGITVDQAKQFFVTWLPFGASALLSLGVFYYQRRLESRRHDLTLAIEALGLADAIQSQLRETGYLKIAGRDELERLKEIRSKLVDVRSGATLRNRTEAQRLRYFAFLQLHWMERHAALADLVETQQLIEARVLLATYMNESKRGQIHG